MLGLKNRREVVKRGVDSESFFCQQFITGIIALVSDPIALVLRSPPQFLCGSAVLSTVLLQRDVGPLQSV